MTRYLIPFPNDAMDLLQEEEFPEVSRAAHAVVEEAKDAGVFIFSRGLEGEVEPVSVSGDGTITGTTYPLGGFTILDVPSREGALEWAAKIAVACRCAKEVCEILFDPLV